MDAPHWFRQEYQVHLLPHLRLQALLSSTKYFWSLILPGTAQKLAVIFPLLTPGSNSTTHKIKRSISMQHMLSSIAVPIRIHTPSPLAPPSLLMATLLFFPGPVLLSPHARQRPYAW